MSSDFSTVTAAGPSAWAREMREPVTCTWGKLAGPAPSAAPVDDWARAVEYGKLPLRKNVSAQAWAIDAGLRSHRVGDFIGSNFPRLQTSASPAATERCRGWRVG